MGRSERSGQNGLATGCVMSRNTDESRMNVNKTSTAPATGINLAASTVTFRRITIDESFSNVAIAMWPPSNGSNGTRFTRPTNTLMTNRRPTTATYPASTACRATFANPIGDRNRWFWSALFLSVPASTWKYLAMPDGEKIVPSALIDSCAIDTT